MNKRMSPAIAKLWQDECMDKTLPSIILQSRLAAAIQAPFIRKYGCLVFEQSAIANPHISLENCHDRSGYESLMNKMHLTDYIEVVAMDESTRFRSLFRQSIKAAMELAERLEQEGRYQIILNFQWEEYMVAPLRFYERRPGELLVEEPTDNLGVGTLVIDV